MPTRFLLPTLGGVFGILVARGQQAGALGTFIALLIGVAVGFGIYWVTSRGSRGGT